MKDEASLVGFNRTTKKHEEKTKHENTRNVRWSLKYLIALQRLLRRYENPSTTTLLPFLPTV